MNKPVVQKSVTLLICFFFAIRILAQTDTSTRVLAKADSVPVKVAVDSLPAVATPGSNGRKVDSVLKFHSPRKAALRSAILPGWGQAYNRKYWKIPIVYAALGISGSIFVFNISEYRDLRFAVRARTIALPPPTGTLDSSLLDKVDPRFRTIDLNALRSYRDEFRRNIDYSVLAFIVLWGLNVVDATVDAHLKTFDVSPDLSFRIELGNSQLAGTTGLSLVLAIK